MILYIILSISTVLYIFMMKAHSKGRSKTMLPLINILITDDSLNVGLANKVFNILESMLIAYQTDRCLQSIATIKFSYQFTVLFIVL